MPQSAIDGFASLVAEARTLFGATHYREYHWLVPVSDTLHGRGLEHHECSEDGAGRTTFENPGGVSGLAGLLAHEYTHSWCGKYRRPAGLATANYQDPMKGELLYVYEGMTQFWGTVLPARAGLWSKQEFLDDLARTCATEDTQSGRTWRNDQDTAIAAQISRHPADGWAAEHRGQDYYAEGVLIWLEADATIRQLSGGKKSLDDFCKLFFGPPSTAPEIRPYTFNDLVSGLEKTQPNDWRTFLRSRLDATGEHAPLGGLSASGWKLVYTEEQGGGRGFRRGPGAPGGEYRYSLGVSIAADGTVGEMIPRMAFDLAGIVPGQRIVGVNGRVFSVAAFDKALKSHRPFDVLVAVGDDLVTRHIDYTQGPKFPHLARDDSKPDLLTEIITSHAKS
jgi:predicted metalloprotease with PDZ domain